MQTFVFIWEHRCVPDRRDAPISIALSPAQVDHVLRASSQSAAPGIAGLISGALRRGTSPAERRSGAATPGARGGESPACHRLSRSLLRGLSLLTCFASEDEERGIVELSRDAGMSASTAHRYALTLVELGLLERSPSSRRYRLPAAYE
ncbi:MAG: IclR family transcriptional regulator [Solirubrobacterales bacterium]|nr:IclR family transcriptional regulator [Solirubrobacterales bacterium]